MGREPDSAGYLTQLLALYWLQAKGVAAGPAVHGALFNFRPHLVVFFFDTAKADQYGLIQEIKRAPGLRTTILAEVEPAVVAAEVRAIEAGAQCCVLSDIAPPNC